MNLLQVAKTFRTEDEALAYFIMTRWPSGVRCLACDNAKVYAITTKGKTGKKIHLYECGDCGLHFSATTGTLFHDSHLPLTKWFAAIALMCEAKKGVSANQVARHIGVSYKTAWHLCHRIRNAMSEVETPKLGGPGKVVEVDETFIGGATRGKGKKAARQAKIAVLGIAERGGTHPLAIGSQHHSTRHPSHTGCQRFARHRQGCDRLGQRVRQGIPEGQARKGLTSPRNARPRIHRVNADNRIRIFFIQTRHRWELSQDEPRPHGFLLERVLLALQSSPHAAVFVRSGATESLGTKAVAVQETHPRDFLALRLTPPSLRGLGLAAISLNVCGLASMRRRRIASNFALSTTRSFIAAMIPRQPE